MAGASRYCVRQTVVPDPLEAADGFVAAIERLVRDWRIDVLVPITEASLLALLPERARFKGVCIPFPSYEQFHSICDKTTVLEAARALEIRVPKSRRLASANDRDQLLPETLRFPLVVKPARSVTPANGRFTKSGVAHAHDWGSLRSALEKVSPAAYPVLLQQRVVGPGVGVFLLIWKGELLASFAHHRIREKPPSGGVSVFCESVPVDPVLLASSRTLLERFAWEGVAMVEYKLDAATGVPYLMEINGRFWGSLQLAIDAGVDFPALLMAAALGGRPHPVHTYRVTTKNRWWWGDVDHLLARLRRSKEELGLPPETPGRWRAIGDFLASCRPPGRNGVLRLGDPMPFVRETLDWVRRR